MGLYNNVIVILYLIGEHIAVPLVDVYLRLGKGFKDHIGGGVHHPPKLFHREHAGFIFLCGAVDRASRCL